MNTTDLDLDKDTFKRAMGKCLHYLRVTRHLSLEDIGIKIGVSAQQIHKYETGESMVSPLHLQQYAAVFNVPVGYFFGNASNLPPEFSFDRKSQALTAELSALPADIRKCVYYMVRIINRELRVVQKKAS
jgi:transcriptional regulator with XRE-family HTH domain